MRCIYKGSPLSDPHGRYSESLPYGYDNGDPLYTWLQIIVSQRLVQSRSETKIWTLFVCLCLVWQLLLTGLPATSCPLVYNLLICSSSLVVAPLSVFFGGHPKFTIVPMGESWCWSNYQLLLLMLHSSWQLNSTHQLGSLWLSKDNETNRLGLVKGVERTLSVLVKWSSIILSHHTQRI